MGDAIEAFALIAIGHTIGILHARWQINREVRAGRMFWIKQHDSREDG